MQFGLYTKVTNGYLRELHGVVSHAKGVPSPRCRGTLTYDTTFQPL